VAGTLEQGLVRLSLGHANTDADVDAALEAFRAITAQLDGGSTWS
jgi:cysteine sulfinate desulfinase/cysteine desulfurase-like protein